MAEPHGVDLMKTGSATCLAHAHARRHIVEPINPDGTVSPVTVLKSIGHMLLDQAAIHAFRQWRFSPGALRVLKIPINFTMKGVTY
jgi:TonB family protein